MSGKYWMRMGMGLLALIGTVSAQTASKKPAGGDVCTPPASKVAPSLPAKLLDGQGTEWVKFPITTKSKEAQRFFLQGVAQMHSFWAVEAERSFLQAAELDPEAPMPWWGVAMVAMGDYRPRFQLQNYSNLVNLEQAVRLEEAVKKAQELSAVKGKATEIEKLYIASIAARRDLRAKDPDGGYIKGLRAILAKDPGQIEAKTYLALHLMRGFEMPLKTPREGSMEAAALLRELLTEAPDHPGVHHYVIHGFEGSTFATDAWPSCKRYAELAPNIPHALHMPGHIWSQTGRWEDAVKSFSVAAENERKWIALDTLYPTGHHGHNVHYLATSHSFQGHVDEAIEAARHLLSYGENPREKVALDNNRTAYRQGWFALLRTLVQNERWDQILDGTTLPEYNKPREMAWRHWAVGLAHAAKGNAKGSKSALERMDVTLDQYQDKVKLAVPAELRVARLELAGHVLAARGKTDQALAKLTKLVERERALIYSEPPYYPRPVSESIGRIALEKGKLDLAEQAWKTALEQFPASVIAKRGLEKVDGKRHQQQQGTSSGAAAGAGGGR
jgi:tetratricopeptide (TPR) repeat protein